MLHAVANALALAPVIHRAPPEIANLQTIINQVQEFYGEGWHTILWEVALITGVLGILAPFWINDRAEKRLRMEIEQVKVLAVKINAQSLGEIGKATETLTKYIQTMVEEANKDLSTSIETKAKKSNYYAQAIPFIFKASDLKAQLHLQSHSGQQPGDRGPIMNIILNSFYAYRFCMLADQTDQTIALRTDMNNFVPRLNKIAATQLLSQFDPDLRAKVGNEIAPLKSTEYNQVIEAMLAEIRGIAYSPQDQRNR